MIEGFLILIVMSLGYIADKLRHIHGTLIKHQVAIEQALKERNQ